MSYVYGIIIGGVILLLLLRIIRVLLEPKILKHKIFDPPNTKLQFVLYYLCAIAILIIYFFAKTDF